MKRSLGVVQRDLAANLRDARAKTGLSQEALALAAEVDRTYVSQIERGVGNPSIGVLVRLAQRLQIDIYDLLERRN
jgi:transcriptional regulator with XRE-family HTH domain